MSTTDPSAERPRRRRNKAVAGHPERHPARDRADDGAVDGGSGGLGWLLAAAFTSGGAVMLVEVLGSRVLGPFFGVGLFVWSSLLAVTLTALALGYYAGGILADRWPTLDWVFKLLIGAGCLVALIPVFTGFVLRSAETLGVRWGALASATALFGPALFVMGMITTAAVRFAALKWRATGKAAGMVYAVSTLGGLTATLIAGFVLVPNFSVFRTLTASAAILVLLGLVGLHFAGRFDARALLALIFPALALWEPKGALASGVHIVDRSETLLGRLSVVQDDSRGPPLRLLRADHSFLGGIWVATEESAFSFVHLLEAVRLANPDGRRLLQIGLGTGALSQSMRRHSIRTDVVEIDPEVVRMAREHFGYEPTGRVYAEDARTLIRRLPDRYDFIVHDTFTGGAVPEHLLSLEVLQRLGELLLPGGVLAVNVVGAADGPLSASAQAVNRTVRAAFAHVRAFRDGPVDDGDAPGSALINLVFFASKRPIQFGRPDDFESLTCRRILTNFEHWEVLKTVDVSAPLITDAHNPLMRLTLPVAEAFWHEMNQLYPAAFWIH